LSDQQRLAEVELAAQPVDEDKEETNILANLQYFPEIPHCRCASSFAHATTPFVTASLQRVRKAGDNCHRLFWSCGRGTERKKRKREQRDNNNSTSGSSGDCGFFLWADSHFPNCLNHPLPQQTKIIGKVTVLRRVLKNNENNGRYFFSCPEKNCSFFQWAVKADDSNNLSSSDRSTALSGSTKRTLDIRIPL
jgi:hypothetical protein